MTKQNAIETVTSYFEEIDTKALVLDLKTTKDIVYLNLLLKMR